MQPFRAARWLVLLASVFVLPLTLTGQGDGADEPKEPLPCTGTAAAELASFDRMMLEFLPKYNLPGGALAVARAGRLVCERGFGYADRDARVAVKPDALFRIASVSKPITAVAILQLAERGKLKLDDKVFDVLGLNAPTDPEVKFDERWRKVTMAHLLYHAGGWDSGKSFDPMFRSSEIVKELKTKSPAGPEDVIRYALRYPLQFEPGERYAYSNFGYCLLGRVIEKLSGQRYEDYVRKEVLAPLGIKRMRIGHSLLQEQAPDEVRYYVAANPMEPALLGPDLGKPVPVQYGGWHQEALDSHGGWIAPASDLVRFAAAFHEPDKCKILSAKSIALMFAPPPGSLGHKADGKPKGTFYACGWHVLPSRDGQVTYWHGGSLPGTSTLLLHRSDKLTWAVLFNARDTDGKGDPSRLVDPLLHKAADEVTTWPGGR